MNRHVLQLPNFEPWQLSPLRRFESAPAWMQVTHRVRLS
jgi:hypothetical protein